MQNQENYINLLGQQREKIDKIDNEIIDLLNQRIKIVEKVKEIKDKNNDDFFIKSAREADMIKNLLKKTDENITPSIIVDIWRKIITSSNMLEQPLKISLHNPKNISDYKYLIQKYYADFVPIISHQLVQQPILDLENNSSQIAVFPLTNDRNQNQNWWINLLYNKNNIKVFAKLPFFCDEETPILFALAKKQAEKSDQDETLLTIEIPKNITKQDLILSLKKCEIEGKIIANSTLKSVQDMNFYLFQAEGFFDENSCAIKNFEKSKIKPFFKIIGHFAKNEV